MRSFSGWPATPRVLLTRPAERIAHTELLARRHGLEPLSVPMLETVPLAASGLPRLVGTSGRRDVALLVFTSATGVRLALERAHELRRRQALLGTMRRVAVAAIGPRTAQALHEAGVPEPLVPEEHTSAGLVRRLASSGRLHDGTVHVLRSDRGDPVLVEGLRAAGAHVEEHALYTVRAPPLAGPLGAALQEAAETAHAFTFGSSSTAIHFLRLSEEAGLAEAMEKALRRGTVAAIGPPTRRALESRGVRVDVCPDAADFGRLLQETARALRHDR